MVLCDLQDGPADRVHDLNPTRVGYGLRWCGVGLPLAVSAVWVDIWHTEHDPAGLDGVSWLDLALIEEFEEVVAASLAVDVVAGPLVRADDAVAVGDRVDELFAGHEVESR